MANEALRCAGNEKRSRRAFLAIRLALGELIAIGWLTEAEAEVSLTEIAKKMDAKQTPAPDVAAAEQPSLIVADGAAQSMIL